jgi:hypothetical protein
MEEVNFGRQLTILDPERFSKLSVDVVGLGGVASFLMLLLLKNGMPNVRGHDAKAVSAFNPPGQLYGRRHIGMQKADALQDIVADLSCATFEKSLAFVTPETEFGDVVFLCIDHQMELRKQIVHSLFARTPMTKLLIETRVDANFVVIQTVVPANSDHREMWDHYWFPDSEAENNGGCTEPVSFGAASCCAAVFALSQMVQWFGNGERDLTIAPDNLITIRMRPFEATVDQW